MSLPTLVIRYQQGSKDLGISIDVVSESSGASNWSH